VSGLVDKSMVVIDRSHNPARYRYLETMRAYAREHLERSGVIAACLTRHASHMAAQAARAQQELVGPNEVSAVAELERLAPDLRAALVWSADQHVDAVIEPIAALAPVLMGRGANEMSGWCFDLRDELADNLAVQSTATLHALSSRGDLPETRRLIERVRIMTDGDLSAVLFSMGYLAYLEGDFAAAIEALERFEANSRATGGPAQQFTAALHLAMMLAVGGFDVRDRTIALVDAATTLRWPSGIAFAHYADGLAMFTVDPVHSLDAFNRALEGAIDAGNRNVEASARRDRLAVQAGILSPPELAREMIGLLRLLASTRNVLVSLLTFSQAVQLLETAGRSATAAMICGWLDGRSGRAAFNIGEHMAAVEAVQSSVGDRWEELLQIGRRHSFDQIIDVACDELATIH
jgi:hypothetical protein